MLTAKEFAPQVQRMGEELRALESKLPDAKRQYVEVPMRQVMDRLTALLHDLDELAKEEEEA